MKQRVLALVLAAAALVAPGCTGRQGQHGGTLPAILLGAFAVGAVVLIANGASGDQCSDPAGRCGGGSMYPTPPESR